MSGSFLAITVAWPLVTAILCGGSWMVESCLASARERGEIHAGNRDRRESIEVKGRRKEVKEALPSGPSQDSYIVPTELLPKRTRTRSFPSDCWHGKKGRVGVELVGED